MVQLSLTGPSQQVLQLSVYLELRIRGEVKQFPNSATLIDLLSQIKCPHLINRGHLVELDHVLEDWQD